MSYGKTFNLDNSMDLTFDDLNRLEMVEGNDKITQDMQVLFRTHIGDNMFHTESGLDFEAIAFNYAENVIKDEVTRTIEQYQYLKEVLSITVEEVHVSGGMKNINIGLRILLYSDEELTMWVVI